MIVLVSRNDQARNESSTTVLKYPRTPMNYSLDFPSVDSDHMSKRTRSMGITDEVNLSVNVFLVSFTGHACHCQAFSAPDDLPKTVARNLNQGSSLMSMDFHLIQQTLLLCGYLFYTFSLCPYGRY
ncbi:hypothetical protein L6452_37359 [Arctium lappa]|uniref:Uncharacterized protein n=1 Tax=Arctium lappa TaxID=4217 RepID=A0ACB8Y389_ARCLA|nr:hypothetical protein L6452_37359 [Arctium lappa]